MTAYGELRRELWDYVTTKLRRYSLMESVRGSWKYGDFHLDVATGVSFSDLDLVMDRASLTDRERMRVDLRKDLAGRLDLPVSIHQADSLVELGPTDSFTLNIAEFVAKTRRTCPGEGFYEYTLAKMLLLLLRSHKSERYGDIVRRLDTPAAQMALAVKLGNESSIPISLVSQLVQDSPNPFVREFFEECVIQSPSGAFLDCLRARIQDGKTIEPWLKEYVVAKINGSLS